MGLEIYNENIFLSLLIFVIVIPIFLLQLFLIFLVIGIGFLVKMVEFDIVNLKTEIQVINQQ